MPRAQPADSSVPPSGSGRATLLAALLFAALVLALLRVGSAHTADSRRFAARPEFTVWTWTYAAYGAAAAAVGLATAPPFRALSHQVGRGATLRAVATWATVVVLITVFQPGALSAHSPLWLPYARVTVANAICGIATLPPVAGLLLVHDRLSALGQEVQPRVREHRAGEMVVELLWLRATLQRFLIGLGVLVSVGVLATGALRGALLADGVPAEQIPLTDFLIYGGFYTGVAALLFVPAYVAWQGHVLRLRDELHPVPPDGLPSHDWHQARGDFDTLLSARSTVGTVFTAAFSLLAPLASSLVAALAGTR